MNTTQSICELSCDRGGWNASFYGPIAARIEALFGTHVLPSGFTALAGTETVVAFFEQNWPGVTVRVRG